MTKEAFNDVILKLEAKLTEADASQEADTSSILDELLAPTAKIVGPKGELYDKEFIVKAHGPGRVPFKNVSVDELSLEVFGETTIVHSVNTYTTRDTSFTLRFFRVWSQVAGKWQVVGGSTTIVS